MFSHYMFETSIVPEGSGRLVLRETPEPHTNSARPPAVTPTATASRTAPSPSEPSGPAGGHAPAAFAAMSWR